MTFEDGMNHGGGWTPSEAARRYEELLDAEWRAEREADAVDWALICEDLARPRVNRERRAA